MRCLVTSVLGLLFVAGPGWAQDRADEAIENAITLLKQRQKTIADDAGTARIQEAIEQLRLIALPEGHKERLSRRVASDDVQPRASGPGASSPADDPPALAISIDDFIDHTEQYHGHTITLPLTLRSLVLAGRGQSLRDLRGSSARFVAIAEDGNRLDMQIELPRGLDLPKASFSDKLVVTFVCRAGNLRQGNVAIAVRRPGR